MGSLDLILQVASVPSWHSVPRTAASCWSDGFTQQVHAVPSLSALRATHSSGSRPAVRSWCSTRHWHWRSMFCRISLRDKTQPDTRVSLKPAPPDKRTVQADAKTNSPVCLKPASMHSVIRHGCRLVMRLLPRTFGAALAPGPQACSRMGPQESGQRTWLQHHTRQPKHDCCMTSTPMHSALQPASPIIVRLTLRAGAAALVGFVAGLVQVAVGNRTFGNIGGFALCAAARRVCELVGGFSALRVDRRWWRTLRQHASNSRCRSQHNGDLSGT